MYNCSTRAVQFCGMHLNSHMLKGSAKVKCITAGIVLITKLQGVHFSLQSCQLWRVFKCSKVIVGYLKSIAHLLEGDH